MMFKIPHQYKKYALKANFFLKSSSSMQREKETYRIGRTLTPIRLQRRNKISERNEKGS